MKVLFERDVIGIAEIISRVLREHLDEKTFIKVKEEVRQNINNYFKEDK